jgi:hypothetical protein
MPVTETERPAPLSALRNECDAAVAVKRPAAGRRGGVAALPMFVHHKFVLLWFPSYSTTGNCLLAAACI